MHLLFASLKVTIWKKDTRAEKHVTFKRKNVYVTLRFVAASIFIDTLIALHFRFLHLQPEERVYIHNLFIVQTILIEYAE